MNIRFVALFFLHCIADASQNTCSCETPGMVQLPSLTKVKIYIIPRMKCELEDYPQIGGCKFSGISDGRMLVHRTSYPSKAIT